MLAARCARTSSASGASRLPLDAWASVPPPTARTVPTLSRSGFAEAGECWRMGYVFEGFEDGVSLSCSFVDP